MDIVRGICSVVHKLRVKNKLPVKRPLYEINFKIHGEDTLYKDVYSLIAEECNSWFIEPCIIHNDGEWVTQKGDVFDVSIRIDSNELIESEFEFNKEKRKEAMRRKELGLSIRDK